MRVDDFYWTHTRSQIWLLLKADIEIRMDVMADDALVIQRSVGAVLMGDEDGSYKRFLAGLRGELANVPAQDATAKLAQHPAVKNAEQHSNEIDDGWETISDGDPRR